MFERKVYLRRRLTALLTLALAVLAASSLWPSASPGARPARGHVVRPGETVWSIASAAYRGDPRAHVQAILQANGVDGGALRVGQRLVLP